MSKTKKILIVDDDIDITNLATNILEPSGYDVLCSNSAEEALHIAQTSIPHLILLDINMPEISGLDFLRHQANISTISSIPVVMLSAINDKHVVLESVVLGAKDYIIKPFSNITLVQKIKKNLPDKDRLYCTLKAHQKHKIPAIVSANLIKASEVELALSSSVKLANNISIEVECEEVGINLKHQTKSIRSFYSKKSYFINIIKLVGISEEIAQIIRRKISGWNV